MGGLIALEACPLRCLHPQHRPFALPSMQTCRRPWLRSVSQLISNIPAPPPLQDIFSMQCRFQNSTGFKLVHTTSMLRCRYDTCRNTSPVAACRAKQQRCCTVVHAGPDIDFDALGLDMPDIDADLRSYQADMGAKFSVRIDIKSVLAS